MLAVVSSTLDALPATFERLLGLSPAEREAEIAGLDSRLRPALARLLMGPDPEGALQRAGGLGSARLGLLLLPEHGPASEAFIELLHQGNYPARLMRLLDPAVVEQVLRDEDPDALDLPELFAAALERAPLAEAIARVRTRTYLHLARRELEHAPLEEVGGALSDLASACIDTALAGVDAELPEQVCVFGMGKLGGRELNFLSDIDLVFVHADEAVAASDEGHAHRLRAQLHQRLRQVLRLLEGSGIWRPVFHVDLRLRPFGSRGPLSLSLSALERYYERHGRGWERQAWLRARPVGGNRALGELTLRRLSPFVWPRSLGPSMFEEIVTMMKRARSQAHASIGAANVDLKHDPGGIREIEFFVQSLQLLNGGRNLNVRTRSTLGACDRLAAAGLLSDREHEVLARAYRVLRRIEHRVQLAEGQQTHRVAQDPHARAQLSHRLAVAAPSTWLVGAERQLEASSSPAPPRSLEGFDAALAELRGQVQAITRSLTGESELASEELADRERAHRRVLDSGASPRIRIHALATLGLSPDAAEEVEAMLEHLYSREQGVLTSTGSARVGAETLVLACLDSADPVGAMRRFVDFAASRPAHFGVWRLMAQPDHGPLVRQVADLFGTSEPLSRGLIGFGQSRAAKDGGLSLLLEASTGNLASTEELREHYAQFEADNRDARRGPRDEVLPLARRLLLFKHRELVRIGLHDLARRPDPLIIGRSLSDLADLVVRELLAQLAQEPNSPEPHPFKLAVLTLGKFGMQAMDYGSDLDLMFVFEPGEGVEPTLAREAAQRISRMLLARLEDRSGGLRLYEVDMRLRPSGRQGLLVSSLTGFRNYHSRPLEVWERLALVRSRAVAEQQFGSRTNAQVESSPPGERAMPGPLAEQLIEDIIPHSVFAREDPENVAGRTWQLKQRIETELARETREQLDIKTGVGGCLELELLISALQLQHGVHTPDIPTALRELAARGSLDATEATELDAAYRFLRRLLNRLRMSRGSERGHSDRLTVNSPRLAALARRMGLADRDTLLSTLTLERAKVRAAFARHLDHTHGGDH